jgi:hypothetical protein
MVPKTYVPKSLSKHNIVKQKQYLKKSQKLAKNGIYFKRPKIKSFVSKISPHIIKAKKMYKIDSLVPSKKLEKKTKCSLKGLNAIVKKGEGAYYSSGSRPSQTSQSWAYARLASALTGGKSSKVDYHILKEHCKPNSKALKLAMHSQPVVKDKVYLEGGRISKNKKKSKESKKPSKNKKNELVFKDWPEFNPNLSPQQIFQMGSFGGTYFRTINSKVVNKKLTNQHKEFVKQGWFKNMDISKYVTSSNYKPSINKYKVRSGLSLEEWERSGWIKPVDPFGWFQWYCRFYCGRRCDDDKRQVDRWVKYAGEKSGRWRIRLINMCNKKGKKYDDYSVSPVIRQGLQHWGYQITAADVNK